ncbi:hypothetical protein C0U40_02785 [Amylibacter cionae]|nr:hypothetical protein C0U40_02785 [Amylibacter cionae]
MPEPPSENRIRQDAPYNVDTPITGYWWRGLIKDLWPQTLRIQLPRHPTHRSTCKQYAVQGKMVHRLFLFFSKGISATC